MQGYVATHGTSPATRKLPYDAIKDFTPIGMIGGTPNVLVVNAALPVKTRQGVRRLPARNPGKAELRLGRPRLADAPDDGAVQAADRHLHACTCPTAASRRPSPTCSAARRRRCSRAWPPRCRTSARAACARWRSPAARARRCSRTCRRWRSSGFKGFDARAVVRRRRPGRHAAPTRQALNDTLDQRADSRPTCATSCRPRPSSRCR